jgi:hypothetical protein
MYSGGAAAGPLSAELVYDNHGNLPKKCEDGTLTVNSPRCTGGTVSDLTHDVLNGSGPAAPAPGAAGPQT